MKKDTVNHTTNTLQWGLRCDITPHFGARLVQEGNHLHYLADRACITGAFSEADLRHLDQAFPLLLKQLKLMFATGELNSCHQHRITLYANGLISNADTQFSNNTAIQEYIDACITLVNAVKFLVERYELVRIDRSGFSW